MVASGSGAHLGLVNERLFAGLGLAGALLCAPACSTEPAQTQPSLRDVQIPADFTFATTRPVTLDLVVEDPGARERGVAVEVRHPDGRTVYRGPVPASGLRLPIPKAEQGLDVTSILMGNERTQRVALAGAETKVVVR